jgi:hypothetical protein
VRAIDFTHSAGPNRGDDFVGAEVSPRAEHQRAEYTDSPVTGRVRGQALQNGRCLTVVHRFVINWQGGWRRSLSARLSCRGR